MHCVKHTEELQGLDWVEGVELDVAFELFKRIDGCEMCWLIRSAIMASDLYSKEDEDANDDNNTN